MHISSANAKKYLSHHGWASTLSGELLDAFLGITHHVTLDAGQPLYSIDDPASDLFGLASGAIAIESAGTENVIEKSFLMHPGVWIGAARLAGTKRRKIGAYATRPSTILVVKSNEFVSFAEIYPDIWRRLLLNQIQNQERAIGFAHDLMRRGSHERLVAVLARMAGLYEPNPPVPAIVDATHREIATLTNLSRGVVSSRLAELERKKLISLGRASITITDPKGLLALL
ncbi:Crp/Fnr family transcriptional regulator [Ruegeria sp. HKCCA5426]|uniref:Crp/Fnr family transcriptional regulator n=1 Tax=Ruegeria sp. HKCCA5426 TaxID=2682985 RepID=UPI00147C9DF4|nr:Crp/Fnr family transcriptional regulator [Ruegeria sp. HKCCA5426]